MLFAFILVASACVETFDARTLGTKTTLASRATEPLQGEPFTVTKTAIYLVWGIGTASRPSLERILSGQIAGDAEIANLRIRARSRFGDVLVSVLTGGLVITRGITYEGVIIHPTAVPPASPPASR
jgi:hypothetical protein